MKVYFCHNKNDFQILINIILRTFNVMFIGLLIILLAFNVMFIGLLTILLTFNVMFIGDAR